MPQIAANTVRFGDRKGLRRDGQGLHDDGRGLHDGSEGLHGDGEGLYDDGEGLRRDGDDLRDDGEGLDGAATERPFIPSRSDYLLYGRTGGQATRLTSASSVESSLTPP